MNYQSLYQKVKNDFQKNEFTRKRFIHIEGVIEMSIRLSRHHHLPIDEEKLKIASLLHDYAKKYSKDELYALLPKVLEEDSNLEDIIKCPSIWHSFIGAYLIQVDLDICDPDIIEAVKYHTTGMPAMNLLSQIIYVSDAIEETRAYEDVFFFRELAFRDFHQALIVILIETINITEQKGFFVHPLTYQTYQYFLKRRK